MPWTNPLGWWPPSPDTVPGGLVGFRSIALGVVATDYAASKQIYDALFDAMGLSGTGHENATNYNGVVVLSQAQESGPTETASIILFVDSAETAESAHRAAVTAGGEEFDGGVGSAPSGYEWKSLRDLDGNVIYIVAQP